MAAIQLALRSEHRPSEEMTADESGFDLWSRVSPGPKSKSELVKKISELYTGLQHSADIGWRLNGKIRTYKDENARLASKNAALELEVAQLQKELAALKEQVSK